MTPTTPTPRPLRDLHDTYVERVNVAISEGRDDRASQLADDFEDAVRDAVLAQRNATAG
jgi:hypothetical protein